MGRPAGNLKQSVIRKIMEQIERIRHFEAMLDRIGPALDALESALDGFDAVQYDVLDSHYQLTVRLLDTVSAILKNR